MFKRNSIFIKIFIPIIMLLQAVIVNVFLSVGGGIGREGEQFMLPVAMSTEVHVAQEYYNWSGGRAFFGRDQFANLFIIGSMQFGVQIFEVNDGLLTFNIDEQIVRRNDLRVGDILAYSGSTVSAAFFPDEIRMEGGIARH